MNVNVSSVGLTEANKAVSWLKPISNLEGDPLENYPRSLDLVLITHPRDEHDLPRLFPWAKNLSIEERIVLTKCLKPVFGEIINLGNINIGILFLPVYAREMIDPRYRGNCRKMLQNEVLDLLASLNVKIICLGGLTGALTQYGKQIQKAAEARGIKITTGHASTAVSVFRTYIKAVEELNFDPAGRQLGILGMGSIGAAFSRLLLNQDVLPGSLLLVDKPSRQDHLLEIAHELKSVFDIEINVELTLPDGTIKPDSHLYRSSYIISAVSNPGVIDIKRVLPQTVLIDDSQPYCWSRENGMKRCAEQNDIAPCEAGLVDCSSIGYVSHFPFDFSDHTESGSHISWSCLAEGILKHLDPMLPEIIGEPDLDSLRRYNIAFQKFGLKTPSLQCGSYEIPVQNLKNHFKNSKRL